MRGSKQVTGRGSRIISLYERVALASGMTESPGGRSMEKSQLVSLPVGKEPEAITRTLAMMAFNPAIGRVLEEDSVNRET